ncbi:hypothetical protein NDU88_001721 [Pleurodeles waltl]|uniref:Uncharacterized protein n=1 Tax=Pleurodeles waltl TaxID=8319 RepID=A0AAV7T056_PLEWA|nr:hypothetical protein NDU88_001721 [Pleurodeles waltl]
MAPEVDGGMWPLDVQRLPQTVGAKDGDQSGAVRPAENAPGGDTGADGGAPDPGGVVQTPTILQAINDLKVTMEGKTGELKVDLALIRQDLRSTTHRVTEVEGRLSKQKIQLKHMENA